MGSDPNTPTPSHRTVYWTGALWLLVGVGTGYLVQGALHEGTHFWVYSRGFWVSVIRFGLLIVPLLLAILLAYAVSARAIKLHSAIAGCIGLLLGGCIGFTLDTVDWVLHR
jgi:hypothetical protein